MPNFLGPQRPDFTFQWTLLEGVWEGDWGLGFAPVCVQASDVALVNTPFPTPAAERAESEHQVNTGQRALMALTSSVEPLAAGEAGIRLCGW